jgi:competence protein ComEC
MSKRKAVYSILIILFLVSLILAGIFYGSRKTNLEIDFLDVGQGDAVLVSQGSRQILIDGGPSGQKVLEKLGQYIPFWDRNIEVIIATHPDQDHIEGLIDVMKAYSVGEIIDNSYDADSQVYKKYLETIGEKKILRLKGEAGIYIK